METLQFKTNLKCDGCVKAITPSLNKVPGVNNWNADLQSPDRIVTVTGEGLDENAVKTAIQNSGYTAERIS